MRTPEVNKLKKFAPTYEKSHTAYQSRQNSSSDLGEDYDPLKNTNTLASYL